MAVKSIVIILAAMVMVSCVSHPTKKQSAKLPTATKKQRQEPVIYMINKVDLSRERVIELRKKFTYWAKKVYEYNHLTQPKPVYAVITDEEWIGAYKNPYVYIPARSSLNGKVETWIHELGHHATSGTGGSNLFFKEGIAVSTLEELYMKEVGIPRGFPQYGATNDAWVNLFVAKSQMPPLSKAIAWPGYNWQGTVEGDYRSWQIYVIGGSFVRWYIKKYGYQTFRTAFDRRKLHKTTEVLEKEWLKYIVDQQLPLFDASLQLPDRPRYYYFGERLR